MTNNKSEKIDEVGDDSTIKPLHGKDKRIAELQDFAIWMTGCGYEFTKHEYYIKNRHLLAD